MSDSNDSDLNNNTQLVEPPYLHKLGFAYNTALGALVCLTCGIAIVPSHIVNHVKNKHAECSINPDRELIARDIELYGVPEHLPSLDLTTRPAFQGLTVHTALQCSLCPKVYVAQSSMVYHHHTEHKGIPVPSSWHSVSAQQLDHTLERSFFPVIPQVTLPLPSGRAILDNIHAAMDRLDGQPAGHRLDPRLVSPWLKSNRWPELVKDRSVTDLRAIVAPLKANEFPLLVPAVHRLFLTSEDMFELVPELVLQRLNTADPVKT
ncbi:hypothetical protein C0993_004588, partial [Termitomyces sp. T159_Od127]